MDTSHNSLFLFWIPFFAVFRYGYVAEWNLHHHHYDIMKQRSSSNAWMIGRVYVQFKKWKYLSMEEKIRPLQQLVLQQPVMLGEGCKRGCDHRTHYQYVLIQPSNILHLLVYLIVKHNYSSRKCTKWELEWLLLICHTLMTFRIIPIPSEKGKFWELN